MFFALLAEAYRVRKVISEVETELFSSLFFVVSGTESLLFLVVCTVRQTSQLF